MRFSSEYRPLRLPRKWVDRPEPMRWVRDVRRMRAQKGARLSLSVGPLYARLGCFGGLSAYRRKTFAPRSESAAGRPRSGV
jgi:hypothetical protein